MEFDVLKGKLKNAMQTVFEYNLNKPHEICSAVSDGFCLSTKRAFAMKNLDKSKK